MRLPKSRLIILLICLLCLTSFGGVVQNSVIRGDIKGHETISFPDDLESYGDLWTDKGGQGHNVDDGSYRLFENITFYFKFNVRVGGPCLRFIGPYGETSHVCMYLLAEPGEVYDVGPIYFNEERDIGEWTIILEATLEESNEVVEIDRLRIWITGGHRVWTDKSIYNVGESVTIYVSPTPAIGVSYWLIIHRPDGSRFRVDLSPGQNTTVIQAGPQVGEYKVELWGQIVYPGAEPGLLAECYYEVEAGPVKCVGTWGSLDLEWSGGVTTDGDSFYITGTRRDEEDIIVLMKVNSDCKVEWVKGWRAGVQGYGNFGTDIKLKDGYLLVTGYDRLLKFTLDGSLVWSKRIIGGPGGLEVGFEDMALIGDSIYIATHHGVLIKATEREGKLMVDWVLSGVGYYVETYGGFIYAIGGEMRQFSKIVKLKDDGQVLWSKDLGELVSDLAVSEYGVYAVAGNKVIKLSHEGDFIWAIELTLNTMHDLHLTGILVDPALIYVYGVESKSLGHQRAIAIVMDKEGNFIAGYAINTLDWQQDRFSLDDFIDAVSTDNLIFFTGDIWDEVVGVDELAGRSRRITVDIQDVTPDITKLDYDLRFSNIPGEVVELTGSTNYAGNSDILFTILRKQEPQESTVLLIGEMVSHNINERYSVIKVESILSCAHMSTLHLVDYKPEPTSFVEVIDKECDWERAIIGKEIRIYWDLVYRELYNIPSIERGTLVEFLGKLLRSSEGGLYGRISSKDSLNYFIVPGIFFKSYLKSFVIHHDFDKWDKTFAANVYFRVNVQGVDDDCDGTIDEEGEYVRLPSDEGLFGRWYYGLRWEIPVRDDEIGQEFVGPVLSDRRSQIPYYPIPISINIEVMDEDPGRDDRTIIPIHIDKRDLTQNNYRFCRVFSATDHRAEIELCLEPILLFETGRLQKLQEYLDLELRFIDINGLEALKNFRDMPEVEVAIIEYDYPDIHREWFHEWPLPRVKEVWDCSEHECELIVPPVEGGVEGDYASHASMTSGIVISNIDGAGAAGLGWNAKLIIIKAPFQWFPPRSNVSRAIKWAVDRGAKVISLSIIPMNNEITKMREAIEYAVKNNVVIVAAAGNDWTSRASVLGMFRPVIQVTGVTRFMSHIDYRRYLPWDWTGPFLLKAPYSNYGRFSRFDIDMRLRVDFSSLSTIFNTTDLGGRYQLGTGTSSAAPALASIIALVQGYAKAKYGRYLTINEVYEVLKQASIDLGDPGWDPYYGWGLVDVKKALEIVNVGIPKPQVDLTALPPPRSGLMVSMSSSGSQLLLSILDDEGNVLFGFDKEEGEVIAPIKETEFIVTENFTHVFLPITSGNFTIVVDSEFAHRETEQVNITITSVRDSTIIDEESISFVIKKREIVQHDVSVTQEGEVIIQYRLEGDINGDGVVDYKDLAILGASYGKREGEHGFNPAADINKDGVVDYKDLAILGANYGKRR